MFFLDNIPDLENHDYYYIFKADIHIPLELHDTFRQYPIAASNRLVNIEELSSSQQETMKNSTISSKLVADLIDKKQFMLGITQYKLYKKLGLQFSNFSECYVFNSDNVYTHIIATNTADRSIAKGNIKALKTMEQTPEIKDKIIAEESISTIKKLTNNICYGLSLCSNVKYRNFELINDLKTLRRRINNPLTRDFRIITSSTETGDAEKFLIGCMKQYQTITCDSAVHIGFALLEYSKVIMAERIHCQLFPYLRENKCTFETCTTDTDSIYIEIDFTNSPWENEWQLKKSIAQEIKDFSDPSVYSKDTIFYNNYNEGCVGLFTDEFPIEDIENLKVPKCMTVMGPKSYAVLYEHYKLIDGEYVSTGLISEKLARKGVKKSDETEQAIAIEDKQKMSDYILGKENTKLIGVDTYHKKEVLNFFHYFALQSGLLLNQDTIEVSQPRLKNNNMIIENFVENKIGLSTRDSKVYLCENGIDFLPFGHYSIKK
jgi:hypothetical protein